MMVLLDISLISELTTKNWLTLLSSAYPMKTASTVLGPIFLFLGSGIETLARQPQTLKNWILGVLPFQCSYGVTSESRWGTLLSMKQAERRASPHRFSGAPELRSIQFTMSISVLFFLSATPLD